MTDHPKMGDYAYFERLYQVEEQHWWVRGMRAVTAGILAEQFPEPRGLKILDAGCGTGMMLNWLGRYKPQQIVGIDLFWEALQFCRSRGRHPLSQSSVLALPFQDEAFDLIVCNDVIQHLPGAQADLVAFGEFRRVLKPGGCLLIRTNSRQGSRAQNVADSDHRLYDLAELRGRAEQSGFQIRKATYANVLFGVVPTIKRYLRQTRVHQHEHHDHGLKIRMLPPHLAWLNALLYRVMQTEAWVLTRPGRASGFGQTIFLLAQKPAAVDTAQTTQTIRKENGR